MENKKYKCPVCSRYEFEFESDHDICPFCGWENDGVQNDDHDYEEGANVMSLNQTKKWYNEQIKKNKNFRWDVWIKIQNKKKE